MNIAVIVTCLVIFLSCVFVIADMRLGSWQGPMKIEFLRVQGYTARKARVLFRFVGDTNECVVDIRAEDVKELERAKREESPMYLDSFGGRISPLIYGTRLIIDDLEIPANAV